MTPSLSRRDRFDQATDIFLSAFSSSVNRRHEWEGIKRFSCIAFTRCIILPQDEGEEDEMGPQPVLWRRDGLIIVARSSGESRVFPRWLLECAHFSSLHFHHSSSPSFRVCKPSRVFARQISYCNSTEAKTSRSLSFYSFIASTLPRLLHFRREMRGATSVVSGGA